MSDDFVDAEDAYAQFLVYLEKVQKLPLTEQLSLLTQISKDIELEKKALK